jgi:2-methylcitrate dehydratase PrpD
MAAVPVTAEIARRATALAWRDLPDDLVERTKQCLLDWFAVTVAGAQEELTDILIREALEDGARGPATLAGRSEMVLPSAATLINGAASHALDYDDVNFSMGGHPTVTVVPALLALGEQMGASGRLFIESFIAGYETSGRIGRLVSPSHYQKGFHVTGTVGSFSATAAAGRMLGLSDKQLAVAFGIAATQAAGLKSNFGTMCKPLHAGTASEHGLRAARLAAKGFTARSDSLECDQGFASSQSDHLNAEAALGEPPAGWHLRNNLFKYHAACYMTHAPIEAARRLREQHGLRPEQIARIRLRLDETCDRVCNIPAPRTGLEAKFSLRLTTAMALAGVDTGGLASYSEQTAADPTLVALRDKVEFDFLNGRPNTIADLDILLTDGRSVSTSYDSGVPAADIDQQGGRIVEKFTALAEPVLGNATTGTLIGNVSRIEELPDLRAVMLLCAV